MTVDAELKAIAEELAAFLTELGLTVIRRGDGVIDAERRTALAQQTHKYRVVNSLPSRPMKSVDYVFPDACSAARPMVENCFTFSEFLDRSVQADRLCERLLDDRDFQRDMRTYVPQHVRINGERSNRDAPRYVSEWLDRESRGLLVVLAPAGYGKTVLTRVAAARLAQAHKRDATRPADPFPFLIPFGEFRRVASFESMILTALQAQGVTDVTSGAFAHLVRAHRCVLMLDGFDELLEERPEEARQNLRELLETLRGDGHVVVTARSTFFRTSTDVADFLEHGITADDVTVLDLEPFDAQQRRELVATLSPDQRTITYVNDILEMEGMGEAMGSPLLLRETIEALRDPDVRSRLSTKTKRSDLFTVLEKSVYLRERNRKDHKFPDRVQERFVVSVAENMFTANARGFDFDLINVLALEAAEEFSFEAPEGHYALLADHHFLDVPSGTNLVRFNHQVFREYFQAKAMTARCTAEDGAGWIRRALTERPLPEEVSRFFSELAGSDEAFRRLCKGVGAVTYAQGHLVANLALLCEAAGTRAALDAFLAAIDPNISLSLRMTGVQLTGLQLGARLFEKLEFANCDLREVDFSHALIRELVITKSELKSAVFAPGSPDVLQFDFGSREFEPSRIQSTLTAQGAEGLRGGSEELGEVTETFRDEIVALLRARVARFSSGTAGATILWDTSILEKNLFGGLDHVGRYQASQLLIPEMVRKGMLTKHRERNSVVYRLTDSAKRDAQTLLQTGELEGLVLAVVEGIAPEGA